MSTSVRSSHPISFRFFNNDDQPVLDILDNVDGQDMKLEITNSSRRELQLANVPASEAGPTNYHFELKFRPGVLNTGGQTTIDGDWSVSNPTTEKNGTVSIYLLSKSPATITPDNQILLQLHHVSAETGGGARGTRVELRYANLQYPSNTPGHNAEKLGPGHREQHLSIVNQRGRKYIPLHVGFVGSNTILNDGSTPNDRTLRITNLLKAKIPLTTAGDHITQFTLSFDVPEKKNEWALGTSLKNIEVDPGTNWNVRKDVTGESAEWIITPKKNKTALEAEETVQLNITNIVSSTRSGAANLYLRYANISGYWDGQFITSLEKTHLIQRDQLKDEKYTQESFIGIGTNDPGANLTVQAGRTGSRRVADGKALFVSCGMGNGKNRDGGIEFRHDNLSQGIGFGYNTIYAAGELESQELTIKTKGKGRLILDPAEGNVGIGTDSPEAKLHVKGNSRFEGSFRCGGLFVSRLVDKDNSEDNVKILSGSEVSNVWPDPPDRKFKPTILVGDEIRIHDQIRTVTHIEESFLTLGAPFPKEYTKATMTVLGAGNVGIGTTSPRSKLAVADGVAIGFAYANEETAPANGLLVEGRIGIGTPSPRAVLEIAGSQPPAVGANALPVLQVTGGKGGNNTSGKAGAGASVTIRAGDGGDALAGQTGGRGGSISLQSGHVGVGTDFQMEDSGFANIILQPAGGSVVIGNTGTNPSRGKLEVVGHVYAQGINGIPMDLAENYLSDNDLAPGDVVCLDRNDDKIILSQKPDDLMVAGVISTEPGFLLNAKHDDELRKDNLVAYPVALRGRVPCKVVDENGSIKRGDLLTTSSTTGHAMKASPLNVGGIEIYRPGTIIGKALASHESGRAVIEVLITGS